jgi:hypothetical protein
MITWVWGMLWFTFVTNPRSVTLVEGDSYRLRAVANRPSAYQWYKDGQAIPGATNSMYYIQYMLEGDAGVYKAAATYGAKTIETRSEVVSYKPLISVRIDGSLVTLTPARAGSKIYYTTDETEPTTNSMLYVHPFRAHSGFVLRACVGNVEMDSMSVQPRKGAAKWTR